MTICLKSNSQGIVASLGCFAQQRDAIRKIICLPGTTVLASGALTNLRHLECLVLPDSLREIQDGAVRFCADLRTVMLPPGQLLMGARAFEGCGRLSSFYAHWLLHTGQTRTFIAMHREGMLSAGIQEWNALLMEDALTMDERHYASGQLLAAFLGAEDGFGNAGV